MSNPTIVKHDTEGKSAGGGVGVFIYDTPGCQSNNWKKVLNDLVSDIKGSDLFIVIMNCHEITSYIV